MTDIAEAAADTAGERTDATRAIERLRLAENRLARRRQNECGPSENARAATRFIFDMNDQGVLVTPTDVAEHLEISTPSVTGILNRLRAGGLITFIPHPDDGRSKYVVPLDREADIDGVDPLTAQIRGLAEAMSAEEAAAVTRFIELVTDAVDQECR
ncbi:MarR family transcriptional regulator [Microbacterium aquimaris]|uniref:MarR family transcriptional regulator n=1 Tax=Microbacterium aquimaris TaxID=459816 RepID=A0ABU5NA04_9MICO|nr:MarR family transcriptional regulator [Microbacterium aquimaris]MDZ8162914.1 MarR family transcriptional regulator [Microbacterium aquimaris]